MNLRRHLADTLTRLAGAIRPAPVPATVEREFLLRLASQCPACAEVPILRRPAVPSVDSASAPEALS